MKTLFQRGMARLRDTLPVAASVTVEIRNTNNEVIEAIDACPGRRDFQQYAVDEYAGSTEVFDWIVVEQDLIFLGKKMQPEEGWQIRYVLEDGRTAIYKAAPNGGKRVFDVLDNIGLMYRIHTNLSSIEDAPTA